MSSDNIIRFSEKKSKSPENKALEDLEDDELMLLARGGVEEAFDTLVKRHQVVVSRVASKILGTPSLADDAVQNTFLAIYRHIHDYQPRGRFRQFLLQILTNHCLLLLRTVYKDKKVRENLSQVPYTRPSEPEQIILDREKIREVDRALSKLAYKFRVVMVLRFAADLHYSEISQVLKIPVGTVKSRLNNGIVKIRKLMKGKDV